MRTLCILLGLVLLSLPVFGQNYGEFTNDGYTTALWLLNESSGTSVADSSGNGHTGTAAGTQSIVNAWFGNGRNFGGGYVSFTDHADFTITDTSQYTWEFVVYPDTLSIWNVVFATYSGTELLLFCVGDTDYPSTRTDAVVVYYESSGGGYDAYTANNSLSSATWYYIAIIYDGSDDFTLYINGEDETSSSTISAFTTLNPTTTRLAAETVYSSDFDGTIDMFRFRSGYEASADEIRQTWAVIKGAYGIH